MNTSLFELFKVGIGPSSSHTVGPMRAALAFAERLQEEDLLRRTGRVLVDLYGSLALTGVGHGTDRAVLLGLLGQAPETVDPAGVEERIAEVRAGGQLTLLKRWPVPFREETDLQWHRDRMYPEPGLPTHPNGLRFTASDRAGAVLAEEVFYSVGGGFVVSAEQFRKQLEGTEAGRSTARTVPFPFRSAEGLLATAAHHGLGIDEIMLANEIALLGQPGIRRPLPANAAAVRDAGSDVRERVMALWAVMRGCMERGIATEGTLPGGLSVRRRAPGLARRLAGMDAAGKVRDPLAPLDAVTMAAMAVNEENAAGGRVVTAPTNGAAGVIPAIAYYFVHYAGAALSEEERLAGLLRLFLTAAAIGILYKENASISGAEVGCQGEVGVACSMAAGGLVAALSPVPEASLPRDRRREQVAAINAQIEHAAEIGMEHNLGMTCDPIGGLVQIPCIERNGMGAVKAVNAARLAMNDTGSHKLSLDQVIETMYRTGLDMQSRYKETSLAGLALNIIAC